MLQRRVFLLSESAAMIDAAMEPMYRYRVTRIWNELRHQHKDDADTPLRSPTYSPLDQYHYSGCCARRRSSTATAHPTAGS
ncbi:MAG: hypothetical protein HC919_13125, partial [Oscillatoriales cyanobacterium SM2_2_1]|nr:hypothetical protein [Oscillatoriales cyanobacterium SM2_2_1]